jgi:multiple sugar transport system substrate-binding protein
MVYDAHTKINGILNYPDSSNGSEKMHWAQHIFLQEYREIYPKSSANIIGRSELPAADEFKSWLVSSKYMLASLGAGFLVICVIVACYKRKKK